MYCNKIFLGNTTDSNSSSVIAQINGNSTLVPEFPPKSSQPLWSTVASQPVVSSPHPIGSKSKPTATNSGNAINSWHMVQTKTQLNEVGPSCTIMNQNDTKEIGGRGEDGDSAVSQMAQNATNQVDIN